MNSDEAKSFNARLSDEFDFALDPLIVEMDSFQFNGLMVVLILLLLSIIWVGVS